MKKEVEVQRIKVMEKLTYADAVKVVRQREDDKRKRAPGVSSMPVPATAWGGARNMPKVADAEQPVGDKVWVDKKQLVVFIAAAINSTRVSTSRTTSIQLIVKAATDHLDMEGLIWEEIEACIKSQSSSQEGSSKETSKSQ